MSLTHSPGTLRLLKGQASPHHEANTALFLFVGDATGGPIREIKPGPGVILPAPRADLAQHAFRLRVLHFNDLHGHIARFKIAGDRPIFSKIAYRIKELRCQYRDRPDAALLALSAGDDFGGTVLDELLGDGPASYTLHAAYRLYSAAGIEAGVIGDHDLDKGSHLLAHAIQQEARFPILSANLITSRWLKGRYYPAALLVIKGVRVGLIGLSTPAAIKPQQSVGLHIVNPVQVIYNLLPALRPLCDILIIVSHLGYSLASNTASLSQAGDVELARSLPWGSVHLIVGGHTHDELNHQGLTANNIVNGIPIVQAGALGNCIGEVDITLRGSCAAVTNARLTPTATLPVDEGFEAMVVQPIMKLAQPFFKRSLGQVANHPDLHTDTVRNAFAAAESALANFITDALVSRCRAHSYDVDLAAIDASSVRCGLPLGQELVFGDWFELMPFVDTVHLCWLTGQELKELLDDNARRADRPDEPHTERGFLQFSRQVRYIIEMGNSRPAARATNIAVTGMAIEKHLERPFLLACSNYTRVNASAWEKFAAQFYDMPPDRPLIDINQYPHLDPYLLLRDELIHYIRDQGGVTEAGGAKRDGRVRFC